MYLIDEGGWSFGGTIRRLKRYDYRVIDDDGEFGKRYYTREAAGRDILGERVMASMSFAERN